MIKKLWNLLGRIILFPFLLVILVAAAIGVAVGWLINPKLIPFKTNDETTTR